MKISSNTLEVSAMKGKFNNQRLKDAMELRCISITELSQTTHISRQTITEYRTNPECNPDILKIKHIAETLNFPFSFFLEKGLPIKSNAAYFRSQLTTKQYYRKAQQVKLKLIASIYDFLKEYIEFPAFNVPVYANLKPENAAEQLRKEWGLGERPIENMIPLLEQHGILIVCLETETDAIDAFTQRFSLDNGDKIYVIGYSANKKSASRVHFDLAHELGHICLHDWQEVDELEREEFKSREQEANSFASAFLLPEKTFLRDLDTCDLSIKGYSKLKRKWRTSIAALLMRANRLGVIDNMAYKDMIIRMQKQGIRKQEPLDNELITAEPSILKTAVNLLLSNNVFDRNDFMNALTDEGCISLYPEQVEELFGLQKGTLQTKILDFNHLLLKQKLKTV